ncbi:energy transducer TonB [Beijerinckia indica]|nr:energy transducer TonB [Beijerinckia indica]
MLCLAGGLAAAHAEGTADAKPEGAFVPPHPIPGEVMKNWPVYPESAKMANQQGVVMLSVKISAQGDPDDVRVKKSSNFPILDRSAVEAVRRWHFVAAKRDNVPVETEVTLPINFSLKEGEQPAGAKSAPNPTPKPAPKTAAAKTVKPAAPKPAGSHSAPAASKSGAVTDHAPVADNGSAGSAPR